MNLPDNIPEDIQNIIGGYKTQLDMTLKFQKCLEEIKSIEYTIEEDLIYIKSIRDYTIYFYNKFMKRLDFDRF
jgi:hypothetical protein